MLREIYGENWRTFLQRFLQYLRGTEEDTWCKDVVRTKDGKGNCLFGHLSNFCGHKGHDDVSSDFDWFEGAVSSTYVIYPINDGTNKKYPQPSPKARCIAYLEDLLSGKELTTWPSMERDMAIWEATGKPPTD